MKLRSVSLTSILIRLTEVFLRKAVLAPEDPYNLRGRSSESYTKDRREDDVAIAEANRDNAPAGNMVVEGVTAAEDVKTYIIDTYICCR